MRRRLRPDSRIAHISLVVAGVLAVATACTDSSDLPTTTEEGQVTSTTSSTIATTRVTTSETDEYVAYVQKALDFMQETFYKTDEVPWERIHEWAFQMLEANPTREGAYEAVEFAARALDTPHTGFIRPDGSGDVVVPERGPPSGERLGDVGYLSLPGTVSGPTHTLEYAGQVRQIMEALDSADPVCGWILDLRESVGGSSWGDWLALGPLVGDGLLMQAGKRGSATRAIYYDDGILRAEDTRSSELEVEFSEPLPADVYVPEHLDVPIAVLISSRTTSAGEAVAVTFAGRPHTRSFGERTFGATTASDFLEMPDGAIVRVADGLYQDRSGHDYENGVQPDEPVRMTTDGQNAVLDASRNWLSTQAPCI